jgi:hypothetical protein
MISIKSDIDNKEYRVRDEEDKFQACNILAKISQNMKLLVIYLNNHKEDKGFIENKEYINRLVDKIDYIILNESSKDDIYTSYSINKGEEIIFCVRSRKNNDIHNMNLMMYVALHELAHVACPIYDNHGPLFKQIFAFITRVSIDIGIYKKIDFDTNPTEYCGMTIDASII